jgi:hypothetical protein
VDRRASAVRLTGFEAIAEVIMPIRRVPRAACPPVFRPVDTLAASCQWHPPTLAAVPTACYTGRKTKPRILCGSI